MDMFLGADTVFWQDSVNNQIRKINGIKRINSDKEFAEILEKEINKAKEASSINAFEVPQNVDNKYAPTYEDKPVMVNQPLVEAFEHESINLNPAPTPEVKEVKQDLTEPLVRNQYTNPKTESSLIQPEYSEFKAKPGERFENQLEHTAFETKHRSPYNMSEERAKRREAALAEMGGEKKLQGIRDEKLFPMNGVMRYTREPNDLPPALAAQLAASQQYQQELQQKQADPNMSALSKPISLSPNDIANVKNITQALDSYPRNNVPNVSKAPTSAAAEWFPQAMTRQLDQYEAMKKVQEMQ
ncbi:MAG: hypothetical protein MJ247_06825 [Alphaproteobacteria bacterium]|nr:hypothetical protein [Alphaproteobacteria bacterium]